MTEFEARPGQLLKTHLTGVANLCRMAFNGNEEMEQLGYLTGVLHDIGKYRKDWQDYLNGLRQRQDCDISWHHAAHGAFLVLEKTKNKFHPSALCIKGHHGHLPSPSYFDEESFELYKEPTEESLANFIKEIDLPEIVDAKLLRKNMGRIEYFFLVKMLFSVLVDADRFDASQSGQSKKLDFITPIVSIPHKLKPLKYKESSINKFRQEYRDIADQNATLKRSLFRLEGPCGIGKTETALSFAVKHKHSHGLSKILYVGPVISIIDQNVKKVFRPSLDIPPDQILEHHSSFTPPKSQSDKYSYDTERWDVPVICTTGVEFFETLVSSHGTQNRKLHNIKNSVILIDEIQSLPLEYSFVLLLLKSLVKNWGCSVVLMSATQPHFEGLQELNRIQFVDIIPKEKVKYFNDNLKHRCTPIYVPDQSLVNTFLEHQQETNLIIANTISRSVDVFNLLNNGTREFAYLASRMCPSHRKDVLVMFDSDSKYFNPELSLVSTQIVEAGIDVSFPVAFSDLAPTDSLFQRMGRVGRNGELFGQMFITDIEKPAPYSLDRINISRQILEKGWSDDSLPDYYRQLYDNTKDQPRDKEKWKKYQQYIRYMNSLDFPEFADFHFIQDVFNVSVLVPYGRGVDYIERLKNDPDSIKYLYREIQPYIAKVPKSWEKAAIKLSSGVIIWEHYDPILGCVEQTPGDLIF
jgi:CRISPR-associated endonuclease/helicase Cas3